MYQRVCAGPLASSRVVFFSPSKFEFILGNSVCTAFTTVEVVCLAAGIPADDVLRGAKRSRRCVSAG